MKKLDGKKDKKGRVYFDPSKLEYTKRWKDLAGQDMEAVNRFADKKPNKSSQRAVAEATLWVDADGEPHCKATRYAESVTLQARLRYLLAEEETKEETEEETPAEELTAEETSAEEETPAEEETDEETFETETPAEETDEPTFARGDFSEQTVTNLVNLCATWGYLLGKATGFTGLVVTPDKIVFGGMRSYDTGHSLLVKFMLNTATKAKTIRRRADYRPENEKFAFRVWLVRMGWKGVDTKAERTYLYKNLTGNSAFATEACRTRWIEKHSKRA